MQLARKLLHAASVVAAALFAAPAIAQYGGGSPAGGAYGVYGSGSTSGADANCINPDGSPCVNPNTGSTGGFAPGAAGTTRAAPAGSAFGAGAATPGAMPQPGAPGFPAIPGGAQQLPAGIGNLLQRGAIPSLPQANPQLGIPGAAPGAAVRQLPSEFQSFVAESLGYSIPIYGQSLFAQVPTTFAPVDQVPVPASYVIGPGDEIQIRVWGQVDVELRAVVDRNGQIDIPKVGTLNVAGIRSDQLAGFLKAAIGRNFRNFDLSASLGQLRSIQVYVVGFANRPGVYTVSSLSTLVNALFASGGPSAAGSMRRIELKRGSGVVTEFDLYDLLLRGDKSKDAQLLPEDVIYIPPVGPLAAISGSVNQPAIYELRGETSLSDLVALAGGLTPTAYGTRVLVERIADRQVRKVDEFKLDQDGSSKKMRDGDLVRVQPLSPRFENAVTLRGNVAYPARFPWREGLRVSDLIPDRESLITPDYWLKLNQRIRPEGARGNDEAALRNDVKRSLAEVNWDYAVVERLNLDEITTSLIPFNLGRAVMEHDPENDVLLQPGDVITIFSKEDIQVPVDRQTKYVRLEGEVRSPGVYQVQPGETLRELVEKVGGFTPNAYLYGAEFTRESARAIQQKRLDESLTRLAQEIERTAAVTANAVVSKDEADAAKLQVEGERRLLELLRNAKATGRIVLNLPADSGKPAELPNIVLEDGDRFVVPARPSTVGVLGSVFNQNAFLFKADGRVSDYLAQAGGPTREADTGRIYVVRADGVVSGGGTSWFGGVEGDRLMPGDTIVVPEDFDRFRFTKNLKDWSQIFYQFAIGVVGLKVLKGL